MPAKKKQNQPEPVWLIKCDGLCIDKAPNEAKAKSKKAEYEKIYPAHMKFAIQLARQETDHCITA